MIDWILNNAFGTWGRGLFDFYFDNSLPINIVVIAYGVVLVFWHVRLRPYRRAAVEQVAGIMAAAGSLPQALGARHAFVEKRMDWSAINAVGPGALVAGRWGLWPRRVSEDSLKAMLPLAELCRDAADPARLAKI